MSKIEKRGSGGLPSTVAEAREYVQRMRQRATRRDALAKNMIERSTTAVGTTITKAVAVSGVAAAEQALAGGSFQIGGVPIVPIVGGLISTVAIGMAVSNVDGHEYVAAVGDACWMPSLRSSVQSAVASAMA